MLRLMDSASFDEASSVTTYHNMIHNRVVSPCGRFESFDCNGFHFEVDWDEIDPPSADPNEEGIPHEQVMAEWDQMIDELERQA